MSAASHATTDPAAWLEAHVAQLRPLQVAANLASWDAATTGDPAAVQRSAEARAAVRRLYADPAAARQAIVLLEAARGGDPLVHRQLELVVHAYTENQLPDSVIHDLTRREGELEEVFYTFRARFQGAEVSNNVLLDVLREERDGSRRREAWEASKRVGAEVAGPLLELVRVRNAAARSLGFDNFYSMQLALQEIQEDELFGLLDGFRAASDAPFAALREQMDHALAARHGVSTEELRPWHWEDFFSQEAPSLGQVELDRHFLDADLVAIAARYFAEIGLPVDDVLARSDLYEREGKDQHAFCTDIDRAGDVRVLCNLRPNERWMATLLHELGHAAYDRYLPDTLPYLLRTAAHTMVTEAVAMYMGRLTRTPDWLAHAAGAGIDADRAADIRRQLRMAMLVSARWILVMSYFERELYRDPDRPDLNRLWWELVESIQRVRRPEGRDQPDWAAKIHLSLAPVYYHNYLLGELAASQLGAAMVQLLPEGVSPVGRPEVGAFLRERIFAHGAALPWNALVLQATGEPLSPAHFLAEFA